MANFEANVNIDNISATRDVDNTIKIGVEISNNTSDDILVAAKISPNQQNIKLLENEIYDKNEITVLLPGVIYIPVVPIIDCNNTVIDSNEALAILDFNVSVYND